MRRRESEGAFARIRWRRSNEKGEEQAVDHSTCWRLGRCPSASSSMNRVTTAFVSSLSAKRKVSSVVFTRNAIDSTMVAIPSFSRLCFTSSVFSAHFESSASSSASNDPTEERTEARSQAFQQLHGDCRPHVVVRHIQRLQLRKQALRHCRHQLLRRLLPDALRCVGVSTHTYR